MPRYDLDKMMCEEPRRGSSGGYRAIRNTKRQKFDPDDPRTHFTKQSMRRPYREHYIAKSFGEHLAPLEGFVRKSVGRKWDDVYSELRKVFKPDSIVHIHIYQHLWDYVTLPHEYKIEDGKFYTWGYYGWSEPYAWRGRPIWYVDQETGILCEYQVKKRQRRKKKRPPSFRVNKWLGFAYDADLKVWFRTIYRPAKPHRMVMHYDYNGNPLGYQLDADFHTVKVGRYLRNTKQVPIPEGDPVYSHSEQASKKDIRKHQLRRIQSEAGF